MNQYCFLILGLDFDVVPDVAAAKRVVIAKTNFWNDDEQQIGKHASYYASLAEQAQRMKNALSTQAGLDKYAQAAAGAAYPVIDELLREADAAAGGQGLDSSKFEGLCKLVRREVARRCSLPFVEISEGLIRRRAEALGVGVISDGCLTQAQKTYMRYAGAEPVGAREFRLLDGDLAPLGVRSLYEFACLACPSGTAAPQKMTAEELLAHARETLASLKGQPVLSSSAEKLVPALQTVVGDGEKRKQYDLFLQWRDINEALESAGQFAELCGGVLGGRTAEEVLARIGRWAGADDARLIVEGYCSLRVPRLLFERGRREGGEGSGHAEGTPSDGPSISCNVSRLDLKVGQTERIEIQASEGRVGCSASDGGIVSVSLDDNASHLSVTALAEGSATLRLQVRDERTSRMAYTAPIPVVVAGRVESTEPVPASTPKPLVGADGLGAAGWLIVLVAIVGICFGVVSLYA